MRRLPCEDDIDSVSEGIRLFTIEYLEKNGSVGTLSLSDAKNVYRLHSNYYELNEQWCRIIHQDPIFLIRFGGKLYAHDGQHRINTIIKYQIPTFRAFILELSKADYERFYEKGWNFRPGAYQVFSENDLELEVY